MHKMTRSLLAAMVAFVEYLDTDCSDDETAGRHLKNLETCLKEASRELRRLQKDGL